MGLLVRAAVATALALGFVWVGVRIAKVASEEPTSAWGASARRLAQVLHSAAGIAALVVVLVLALAAAQLLR